MRAIAKIDTNTNEVVDRISTGNVPTGVRVAPSGDYLITSNRTTDSVTITNLPDASSTQIPVGANPGRVRFSPDGTLAVTANKGDDTISLIDTKAKEELARIRVGKAPRAAEFTPDGSAILVANHADGSISVVDVAEQGVTQTIPVGPTPLGLLVTDSQAYISHEDTGEITVLKRTKA